MMPNGNPDLCQVPAAGTARHWYPTWGPATSDVVKPPSSSQVLADAARAVQSIVESTVRGAR